MKTCNCQNYEELTMRLKCWGVYLINTVIFVEQGSLYDSPKHDFLKLILANFLYIYCK